MKYFYIERRDGTRWHRYWKVYRTGSERNQALENLRRRARKGDEFRPAEADFLDPIQRHVRV